MHQFQLALTAVVALSSSGFAQPPRPLTAVPFTDVRFDDEFWAPRQKVTREKTLWENFQQCEETGRIENLRRAGKHEKGKYEGYFFNDSDVFKALEGACYQLAVEKDPKIEKYVDDLIGIIAAAQEPDGYLDAYYTLTGLENRWTKESDMHETYVAGHLIEAAVAHFQATGKRTLLDVAIKLADHIDSVFGPGKRAEAPGHEEIELALVKLWRITGDEKYFKLAKFFLDCRGVPRPTKDAPQGTLYGEYCQDHLPVREHTEVVGHAVRAMYLYCGVADVAAVTRDQASIDAMQRVWEDLTQKKVYVTGGIGPSASNEGFTVAYDLPNETAYAESCASIGLALWSHRLNLLHADASYFDVFERVLYNGMLSSVSLDGEKYFYVNPLTSTGKHHRLPWYKCACCPPNILRFLSSLGGYAYATDGTDIYVNLYAGGEATVKLKGASVALSQQSRYPWDGRVRLTARADKPVAGSSLLLRIPGWCRNASFKLNGEALNNVEIARGYASIGLTAGETTIDIDLPMPIERIYAHPSIKADVGRVALQRGPVVYCLEEADVPAGVRNLALAPNVALTPEHRKDFLGGVTVIKGRAMVAERRPWEAGALYAPGGVPQIVNVVAIPYYAWDNRQPGEMVVWLAESPSLLIQPPLPDATTSASHCWSTDTPAALNDAREPSTSSDRAIPRLTFWPHKGTTEWAQYEFRKPRRVSGVSVYFYDDARGGGGGCKPPVAWRVLYKAGEEWKPVALKGAVGSKPDQYNAAKFEPVTTSGLRLELDLEAGFSAGILEWKVEP